MATTHTTHFHSRKANRAVDAAVNRLQARNPHCQKAPAVFIRDWIDSFVHVLVEAREQGDDAVAKEWIAGDAPLRMRNGFDLADIVDALDESERAVTELLG